MATFHSVKDAVKLFNADLSGGEHLPKSPEQGVLVEETNLCPWSKEVNMLKEKIKNAEMAKIEASLELEEAKKTVEHLNHMLGIRQNMGNDEKKAIDLSSSDVEVVTSELSVAKELLQRVAEEASQLGTGQNMRNEKALDLSSNVIVVTSELGVAKESLHRVAEEESELCILMESLKLELQNVKKEHSQLKEKEQRETDQAIEGLKKEAEEANKELLLLEEELKIALFEAEEAKAKAKAAEEHAANVPETLDLKSDSRVLLAEMKQSVAAVLTETEALRACRDETLKKLEMSEREIEDIKAATQDALKKAELAEEATIVVDAELRRRRKAASKMLAESKTCAKSFPSAKEVHKSKSRSKETCLVKC